MRRRLLCSLVVFVLTVAMGLPAAEAQTPATPGDVPGSVVAVPDGWTLEITTAGTRLSWQPSTPIPVRDARPEFHLGDVVIGYPTEIDGRLVLNLGPDAAAAIAAAGADADLSVWLGILRLDGPGEGRAIPGGSDEVPRSFGPRTLLPEADDPGRPGRFETRTFAYDLDLLPFPSFPAPLEVVGEVIAPVGARGARPLVLFLHGRHGTCYIPGDAEFVGLEWPCVEPAIPIPSHLGYRYVAELLASKGYMTVSISANGVNAQDGFAEDGGAAARSALIHHHLELFSRWNRRGADPWGGRFEGKIDLDNVVLVGHSRGGEGVERATVDAARNDPYTIVGLVDIAPTAFGRQAAAGVPTAVLLPYCDGDVADLQGQAYVDHRRDLSGTDRSLRSAIMVFGANHNYFNTEWTPGLAQAPANDDWGFVGTGSPVCRSGSEQRLRPRDQQRVGAAYIAALVHTAVERDGAAASLLDGSAVRARSAGPAVVLTHALGANRRPLFTARPGALIGGDGVDTRICDGALRGDFGSVSECSPTTDTQRLPHWLPFLGAEERTIDGWDIRWRRSSGDARARATFAPTDLGTTEALEMRVAADPSAGPVAFDVRLVDENSNATTIGSTIRLRPLPGERSPLGKVWAQTVRIELDDLAGIDPSRVTTLEIAPVSRSGRIWVLDAHAWNPGLPSTSRIWMPQVSVGRRTVTEGDSRRQIDVALRVRGRITVPGEVWAVIEPTNGQGGPQLQRVALQPGRRATIRITIDGDDRWSPWRQDVRVTLLSGRNATTGRYQGVIRVLDDEPAPTLTFAVEPTATEGGVIRVRATLSERVRQPLFYYMELRDAESGLPPLDTDDVADEFVIAYFGERPVPALPLSQVFASIEIPRGRLQGVFEIPLRDDGIIEPDEGVDIVIFPDPFDPLVDGEPRFPVVVTEAPA